MSAQTKSIPSGPAVAAMISAGIGGLTIGILTTGAVISAELKTALNIYNPAGPLSGKTTFGIAAWLISWLILNAIWKDKDLNLRSAFTWTMVLLALGLLLTFPPIFESFEA
jgi:hypothetical protein